MSSGRDVARIKTVEKQLRSGRYGGKWEYITGRPPVIYAHKMESGFNPNPKSLESDWSQQ